MTKKRAVLVAAGVALVVALAFAVAHQLLEAYKRSWAKRRVAEVSVIACAIEQYRVHHGRLPTRDELVSTNPTLGRVISQKEVLVTLTPQSYSVIEAEPGSDARTNGTWEIVDGKWRRWSDHTTTEMLQQSERTIR